MAILQYIKDNLLIISTLITSVGIIAGFVYKLFKRLLKKELEPFIDMIKEQDKKREEQHEETMQLIAEVRKEIAEVRKENDMGIIDALISRIDAFDMLCRTDINFDIIQLHQYDNIFIDIQKWNDYHIKYPELNGKLDVAIENIKEHYKKAKFK